MSIEIETRKQTSRVLKITFGFGDCNLVLIDSRAFLPLKEQKIEEIIEEKVSLKLQKK